MFDGVTESGIPICPRLSGNQTSFPRILGLTLPFVVMFSVQCILFLLTVAHQSWVPADGDGGVHMLFSQQLSRRDVALLERLGLDKHS